MVNSGLSFKLVLLKASSVVKPVACLVSKFKISKRSEFVWLLIEAVNPHLLRFMVSAQLPVIGELTCPKEYCVSKKINLKFG